MSRSSFLDEFPFVARAGEYTHKPRWRPDGYGFGEPFPTWGPSVEFMREMIEMALTWKDHSFSKLCDLVERLPSLTDADQTRVWALVEAWAKAVASDGDKAAMREKIRVATLSKRAAMKAAKENIKGLAAAGKAAYDALEPSDLLNRYVWLFLDGWVEESADEAEDIEEIDFRKRDEQLRKLRSEALLDVWRQRGAAGILKLSERGRCSWIIGMLMASEVLPEHELDKLLRPAVAAIFAGEGKVRSHENLLSGALCALEDEKRREAVFKSVTAGVPEKEAARLLVLAPYRRGTWGLVDALAEKSQSHYWNEVAPHWIHDSESENNESVERLLKAGRPRAAFECVKAIISKLDTSVLFKIISEIARDNYDKPRDYILNDYHIQEAFKRLNSSSVLTLDQKAGLEFAYLEVLGRPWGGANSYGIPNLERYVEIHPELFVQPIPWTYKRKDGKNDPAEFRVPSERVESMADRGYKLLEAIERIPGHNDLDELETPRLAKWIDTVRRASAELSRADIADVCIGKVLSCAPIGSDGT